MITITKNGNAVLFEFEENQHYLYNGTIEVPLNSLSLVTDESEMFTFKKAATNDIFISARYDDVNMSKSQLIDFYIANMVGSTGGGSESGITSGDVQTMINTSLEDYYDIDEIDAALSGKQDTLIAGSGITISGNVISADGGGIDSGTVQTMIDGSISGKADTSSVYTKSEVDAALDDKADSSAVTQEISAAVTSKVDTTAFTAHTADTVIHVTSAEKAAWNAKSDFSGDYNDLTNKPTIPTVPTSNTAFTNDAGYITSSALNGYATEQWVENKGYLTEHQSLNNYYTKSETDDLLDTKLDVSAYTATTYTKSEVDTALSGKQDVSGMTAYTTSSDVETYVSGYTYDKATIDSKVASGGTFDPTNYYDKTATDALLDDKFDASAFTSYSAATDARISEDEEVTAAALNALNDGKQDTLIAGSGITISGNVISAEGGNLVIELTQAEYDALVDKDPNAFYIITDATEINISDYYTSAQTQSAINAAVSGKQDTLIAGSGITISGNVISATGGGGGGKAIEAGRGISITTGETADTVSFNLPISAGTGTNSIVMGEKATANGSWSFANGNGNIFYGTSAAGERAIAIGYVCEANGNTSIANGQYCRAYGIYSHAIGSYVEALNDFETSIGKTNVSNKANDTFGDSGNTLFSVGNGTTNSARHNAFEIRQNGDIYITLDGQDVKLQDQLGGGSITIDPSLDSGSTNAVANSAVSAALNVNNKFLYNVESKKTWDGHPTGTIQLRYQNPYNGFTGTTRDIFALMKINNIPLIEDRVSGINNLNLVETSAITTSITSSSTDAQVPSAKAVYDALQESGGGGVSESAFTSYSAATDARISEDEEVTAAALNALNDKFDGLRLKKLTQAEYEALTVKDNNTLYVIVG